MKGKLLVKAQVRILRRLHRLDKLNGLQTAVVPAWATILPIDCCCAEKAHACAELRFSTVRIPDSGTRICEAQVETIS